MKTCTIIIIADTLKRGTSVKKNTFAVFLRKCDI